MNTTAETDDTVGGILLTINFVRKYKTPKLNIDAAIFCQHEKKLKKEIGKVTTRSEC